MVDFKVLASRFARVANGITQQARATTLQSLAVAQMEPDFCELARSGSRFAGGNGVIAQGIAPVSAIPTTTATLALYNSADPGGKSLVVDRLTFWLGSGTAAAGATLLASVSNGQVATAVTAHSSNYFAGPLTLKNGGSSVAFWGTAVTVPAGTVWWGVQSTFQLAAANVGQGDSGTDLRGVVIPPKYALGIAILSGAGTSPLYGVSAMWSELELDLESN